MSMLAVLAGLVSTAIFASSMLPMVVKAVATRDLTSYSLSHLVLVNSGNALYSFYVYSLPLGPIWLLHTFHLSTSAVMLVWYLRFARGEGPERVRLVDLLARFATTVTHEGSTSTSDKH